MADSVKTADIMRLQSRLDEAVDQEAIAAIAETAKAWAEQLRAQRIQSYNALVGIAFDAEAKLDGRPNSKWGGRPDDARPAPLVTAESLAAMAAGSGLEDHVDDLLALTRPSLRLEPEDMQLGALPFGATRLGGVPDLPDGIAWPRREGDPLAFLAQLDLAEVHLAMPGAPLPPNGWLLFFYDVDACLSSEGNDFHHLVHVPGGTPLARVPFPDDLLPACRYSAARARFMADLTPPGAFEAEAERDSAARDRLSDGGMESAKELFCELEGDRETLVMHRLFGYPQCWQIEILGGGSADPDDDVLLLQLDSDARLAGPENEGFFWGSGGRLYWVLPREDAKLGRFESVSVGMQFT